MRRLLLLGILTVVLHLPGQLSADDRGQGFDRGATQQATLLLFKTGSGKIVPFDDGQMLEVGRRYVMTAVPERGYTFTNWNPVTVFTFVEKVLDESGNLEIVTNTVLSPVAWFTDRPALTFEMQPEEVIVDMPALTITVDGGWQANFVAEQKGDLSPPSSFALSTATISGE